MHTVFYVLKSLRNLGFEIEANNYLITLSTTPCLNQMKLDLGTNIILLKHRFLHVQLCSICKPFV